MLRRFQWGGLLLLAACAASSQRVVPTTSRDSDATANLFLTAFRDKEFATAEALFDASLKAALPKDKLTEFWNSQLKSFGLLRSWKILERAQTKGADLRDIRMVRLQYERGELDSFLLINPGTQQLSLIRFQPVQKPPSSPSVSSRP